VHKVENLVDTPPNSKDYVFGTLVINHEIPSKSVVTKETNKLVKGPESIRIFVFKLVTVGTDLININNRPRHEVTLEKYIIIG
jgi:hypothetical protein